jgi:uncharacterized protein YgbK (DUF1537 family)
MSRHPITPMNESDLRLHLAKQSSRKMGLVDIWHMDQGDEVAERWLRHEIDAGNEVILFDTISDEHMRQIGKMIWGMRGERPVLLVGSSGFERALGIHLQGTGQLAQAALGTEAGTVERIVVMSGSCAPGTRDQIDYAIRQGFADIRIDSVRLVDPALGSEEAARVTALALNALAEGRSPLLYSAQGPDDSAIGATKTRLAELGQDPLSVGHVLGAAQGRILRTILKQSDVRRVCVAGGDTCGYAAQQLGIFALQVVIPVAPGAPLCRASSDDPEFEGLQISLKGGQNGEAPYFVQIRNGRA